MSIRSDAEYIVINMKYQEQDIEWRTSQKLISLRYAQRQMEKRVGQIISKSEKQLIWILEHPASYTAGTSSKVEHLLHPNTLPVYECKRGGSYTYHGPGQRVVYTLLNLKDQDSDIKRFVWNLENWIIKTLENFNIHGYRIEGRTGVWVASDGHNNKCETQAKKIASIGLRLRKWISFYGISINNNPDLSYFDGIISCGNKGFGVTSFADQGVKVSKNELDIALKKNFNALFMS